jgi:spermidine/putrescine transport system substrate-binding protein
VGRRWTEDDFHEVCDQVEKHVGNGRIRRFTGNDYTKDLVTGDVLACQAYSGDVIQLQADNPDIRFVAERLVDYYYDPEVAAELAAWVNYVCPVPAARDVLAASKDEDTAALAENPLIFPEGEMRGRLAIARDITSKERVRYAKRWNGIVGL